MGGCEMTEAAISNVTRPALVSGEDLPKNCQATEGTRGAVRGDDV